MSRTRSYSLEFRAFGLGTRETGYRRAASNICATSAQHMLDEKYEQKPTPRPLGGERGEARGLIDRCAVVGRSASPVDGRGR